MEEKFGKKIFNGIAIGKIKYYTRAENKVVRTKIADVEAELARYEAAKKTAVDQLQDLYEKAVVEVGETNAEIFHVHAMMLDDDDYNESVQNIIATQGVNVEYAAAVTGDNFAEMFANMDDEYFKARSADIRDITERLLTILCGGGRGSEIGDEPVILLAEDLAPSETVQMDKSKLLAFVTRLGSANSHTAILARTMGIPALVGVDIRQDWDGKIGVVDGYEGKFIIDPEMPLLEFYFKKKAVDDEQKELLQTLKNQENVTKSGQKINLYANIGNPGDLPAVLENDAGGIGLFRSEFLYLEAEKYPTEEEQFQAYKKVVETMGGKKVIIRTLDIGADKQVDYFQLDKEENPAMGYRAIRICLTRPEIFRTQLRALFRASGYGNLAIMYPMIISVDEVRKIKEISLSVRKELLAEGVKLGQVEEGIMIETPAAAIISDELAREVDFFSIGTNDLTQYTLAIDRQNAKLDTFYDSHHPAVLWLIQRVTDNAHKAGIWVGICGELGADVTLTETFLRMGVDELSVSPGCVLLVRKAIRETEIADV
ncbi:MAG: phosphoenolpyruvate--protein phosphotransferase [Lachnospiraceae bacterium]|nr:phosphoenolpyruvate--protein phosphotransferase [Lachnospiraceae bacterium]